MSCQRRNRRFAKPLCLAALGLMGLNGCATKQQVALDCLPEQVTIFVDGERLDHSPKALELDADRPHTVLFRAPGYRPRMVVVEPDPTAEGRPALQPARICADLFARAPRMQRHLDLQVDPQPPAKPDGAP